MEPHASLPAPAPRLAALAALVGIGAPAWIALAAPRTGDEAPRTAPVEWRAPRTLAETGLYTDASMSSLAPGVLEFAPQYPLWTDGARKRRWIALPAGASVDASDADHWRFPPGARLWKEFAYERRVETRFMELDRDGVWRFATYVWSEDESEALLAPAGGVRTSAGAARHDVPSLWDCAACHNATSETVLGFSALQLSPDRDPLAPHAAREPRAHDLRQLVEIGVVRHLPQRFVEQAPRIEARSAMERAALGYMHGNCGGCHDSQGALAGLELDLAHSLTEGSDVVRTTFDAPTRTRAASAGDVRIAPGAPERSALLARVSSRDPRLQMPPLGTHVVDERALALLRDWIRTANHAPEPGASDSRR